MFILSHIRCSPEILATIKRRPAHALTVDLDHTDLHQLVSRKWSYHRAGPEVGVIITWQRFQRAVWVSWWLPWLQWIKRYYCVRKGREGVDGCLLQEQLPTLPLTLSTIDGVWLLPLLRRFTPVQPFPLGWSHYVIVPFPRNSGTIHMPHPRGSVSVNRRRAVDLLSKYSGQPAVSENISILVWEGLPPGKTTIIGLLQRVTCSLAS